MIARLRHWLNGSEVLHAVLAWAVVGYIRLCARTIRWERWGEAGQAAIQGQRGRHLMVFWHGRLCLVPAEARPGLIVRAFISRSRDGDLSQRINGAFGIGPIRGSSQDPRKPGRDRGGRDAYGEAVDLLKAAPDMVIALTPDGPRGPRMRCKAGVAVMALRAGVAVVPWTYSVRAGWELPGWDRFLVPRPFTRGVIAYGDPIRPPEGRSPGRIEAHRRAIEDALTDLTRAVDRHTGRVTPQPAPVADAGALPA